MSGPDTTNGRSGDQPPAHLAASDRSVAPVWTWLTTTVIERTAGAKLSTAEVFALLTPPADWVRTDGSHWVPGTGGRPAAFKLSEARLLKIQDRYGISNRAMRRHLRKLADADLAHLCSDGLSGRERLVTLFPSRRLDRPCPGCRTELTDADGRSHRRSWSVTPTRMVGEAESNTGADVQEQASVSRKAQPGENHEEAHDLEDQERSALARARAVLDPVGTAQKIAALKRELEALRPSARKGHADAQRRYLEAFDELNYLERARAS
jgi:hypothetical protein